LLHKTLNCFIHKSSSHKFQKFLKEFLVCHNLHQIDSCGLLGGKIQIYYPCANMVVNLKLLTSPAKV
jgi:hypothetical protein